MGDLAILVLNSGSSSIKFSVYGTGDGEPLNLHEGSVDGIGTDQGEFWIKDAKGKKLVNEFLLLPTPAAAFKLVADALHSKDFSAPLAIGHRMASGGPTVQTNQQQKLSCFRSRKGHADYTRQRYRTGQGVEARKD